MSWFHKITFGVCFVIVVITVCSATDETPGFFLKVTKNVPRLGRRSQSTNEFENFFLKASKTVPRIGRRDDPVSRVSKRISDTK